MTQDGSLKFNESLFTKIGDVIRRFLQEAGLKDVKFDTGKDVFNFVVNAKNEIVTPGVVGIIGGFAPYVGTVFSIAQQVLSQSGHFSRLGQEYVDFANAAQMPSVNRGKSTIYSTAYLSSEDPNNAKSFISMDLEDLDLHDMISMQMN